MQPRVQDGYINAITQGFTPPLLISWVLQLKPSDEYPLSALMGHRGAGISGAVASITIGLGVS